MPKEPLTCVEIRYTLSFLPHSIVWDVRSAQNGGDLRMVVCDTTNAPTSLDGADVPWGAVVVDQIVERALEVAYSHQLQLPFP